MANNDEGETPEPIDILTENQYHCTECKSPIEIISLNEKKNELEFKCFNQTNSHRMKMDIKLYLEKIKRSNYFELITENCKEHNNLEYKSYCLNCKKHLCKKCLDLRDHIYHTKINILEIVLTDKEKNVIEQIISYLNKKEEDIENIIIANKLKKPNEDSNNGNQLKYNEKDLLNQNQKQKEEYKSIKDLIYLIYSAYKSKSNNYYNTINLYNIIIICFTKYKYIKEEIIKKELQKEELEKLMKVKKNVEDILENELKSIINEYNQKVDILLQKFDEEKKFNQNIIIKRLNIDKIQKTDEGIYVGNLEKGLKEGRGKFFFKDGDIYEGEWKKDKKEGKGVYLFNKGNKYEGDFKDDMQDGKGIYYFSNGDTYEGDFKNGQFDGNGVIYFKNGDREIGKFYNDKKIGIHIILTNNGKIIKNNFN